MSATGERQLLGSMFDAGWAGRTPIAWPNMKFTPPNPAVAWVRFSIVQAPDAQQIEIGTDTPQYRATGRVYVQVFVPLGSGDAPARMLADAVVQLFRQNKQMTDAAGRMILREPAVRDVGPDGQFYQLNVSAPYLYDSL